MAHGTQAQTDTQAKTQNHQTNTGITAQLRNQFEMLRPLK